MSETEKGCQSGDLQKTRNVNISLTYLQNQELSQVEVQVGLIEQ
jgi:hypothetical protein